MDVLKRMYGDGLESQTANPDYPGGIAFNPMCVSLPLYPHLEKYESYIVPAGQLLMYVLMYKC